jgi:hypothetical protein
VALQLLIGVTGLQAIATWPVTSFKMFADTTGQSYTYVTTGRTPDGRALVLDHDVLGLTELQLGAYLRERVADRDGTQRPGAQEHLEGVAALWGEELGTSFEEIVVRVEVRRPSDEPDVSELREVARWRAS